MQIPPESFVAGAEGAGLGAMLDAMVLDLACREVQAAGLHSTSTSTSVRRGWATGISNNRWWDADRHAIEADRLVLEITEPFPIVDLAEGAAAISRLRAMGVRVALMISARD